MLPSIKKAMKKYSRYFLIAGVIPMLTGCCLLFGLHCGPSAAETSFAAFQNSHTPATLNLIQGQSFEITPDSVKPGQDVALKVGNVTITGANVLPGINCIIYANVVTFSPGAYIDCSGADAPSYSGPAINGQNAGAPGSNGLEGKHGANGGSITIYARSVKGTVKLTSNGGLGGPGQDGGSGAQGSAGANGTACNSQTAPGNGQPGQPGGAAGTGGPAGSGGDAGQLTLETVKALPTSAVLASAGGAHGSVGAPGKGGVGGQGGQPGKNSFLQRENGGNGGPYPPSYVTAYWPAAHAGSPGATQPDAPRQTNLGEAGRSTIPVIAVGVLSDHDFSSLPQSN